ncbi:MAG TPA: cold-shock protein [Bacilli bacterium]
MFKKQVEAVPEADTAIWTCTTEGCNGWMRADYTFDNVPTCPLCHGAMANEIRRLPVLQNQVK